jgi:hypothetical protein
MSVNSFLHNLQFLYASNFVTKRIETIPRQRVLCPARSDARKIKGAVYENVENLNPAFW